MSQIIQNPGPEVETPELHRNPVLSLFSRLLHGGARLHASNAAYSVGEYIAMPILMLVSAPFLIARLGLQQYGIWMLVTAIIGSMGNLSAGFGDATVKYVSAHRGRNDMAAVERAMRATLAINLVLGGTLGLLIVVAARTLVEHVFKVPPAYYDEATRAIQISGFVVLARSLETVFVGTLRAFERYGPAVRWNVAGRTAVVTSAIVLAALGHSVDSIMLASLLVAVTTLTLQAYSAGRVIGRMVLLPSLNREGLREIASFGCFSWLQGLASVLFTYADRFIVAGFVSMDALAIYTVCVQITQPIHGVFASGFNFLFPHLSTRIGKADIDGARRLIRYMRWMNIAAAIGFIAPFLVAGKWFLTVWLGQRFAAGFPILALLAISFGILGASVVPHYALLALGRVRFVSATTVTAGLVSLLVTVIATSLIGVKGAALGRLVFSSVVAVALLPKLSASMTTSAFAVEGVARTFSAENVSRSSIVVAPDAERCRDIIADPRDAYD
jgi:O-antigen/teichoic acid export membrane protein